MKNINEDEKPQATGGARPNGKQGFKKKYNNKHRGQEQTNTASDFFKGFGFSMGSHGPEMYQKTVHKVGLYASMQFKNGSDTTICLLEEKLVKPEIPVLEDEHTAHEKRVWEHRMNDVLKTEKQLEGNLRNLFMVLMSLCDSTIKNKIENTSEYPKLMKRLDTLGLLSVIKKLVYTGSTSEHDVRHNKATALLNLMNLHQEKFQSIQDFRDQYLAMKKVCDVLDLRIGRCESDARELLKKKNVTNPTDAQLSKAMDKIEQELHAIIFMYKTDRQKYGNILDQMENDVLQKKDPFPKTVSEASSLIEGWKGKSNNSYYNRYNEANDGVAFATDGKEEKTGNKNKKKEITCFKCGVKGHYSNECEKEQADEEKTVKASNKTASNFFMTNDNQHGYSSDEDASGGPYAECDFTAYTSRRTIRTCAKTNRTTRDYTKCHKSRRTCP